MKETFSEQVTQAQSLIGKIGKADDGTFEVEGYEIVTNYKKNLKVGDKTWDLDYNEDILKEQGYQICLYGPEKDHFRYVCPLEDFEETKMPSVTINGYNAVPDGEYWKFGCAKINKALIVDLYELYKEYRGEEKEIVSVKIGAGIFTIKDLEELVNCS